MIILYFIFIWILFFNYSCRTKGYNREIGLLNKKTILKHPESEFVFSINDSITVKSINQIFGTWEHKGKEEFTIVISKNRYSELEHRTSYKYKFENDSIRVKFNDFEWIWKPVLFHDTLLMINSNGYVLKNVRLK